MDRSNMRKCVLEKRNTEGVSTDEQNATSGPDEAKTGRGRAGLVPGGRISRAS